MKEELCDDIVHKRIVKAIKKLFPDKIVSRNWWSYSNSIEIGYEKEETRTRTKHRKSGFFGGVERYQEEYKYNQFIREASIDLTNKMIKVFDGALYEKLKLYGDKNGFKKLIKCWPELAEE